MSSCITLTGQKESALLVADSTGVKMLLLWQRVLRHVFPQSKLAFSDFNGEAMTHLEHRIQQAAEAVGHSLPTATMFRKQMEICNKRQEGPTREAVSRALSHSLSTAQVYYQAPTLADTYSTYRAIRKMIAGETATSPAPGSEDESAVKGRASEDESAVKGRPKGKGKGKQKARQ